MQGRRTKRKIGTNTGTDGGGGGGRERVGRTHREIGGGDFCVSSVCVCVGGGVSVCRCLCVGV